MRTSGKILLLFSFFICSFISKSQTCTSPVTVAVNNGFMGVDSFANSSTRFLKFTANNFRTRIKLFIKNYNPSSNVVNIYNNDCANLATNKLNGIATDPRMDQFAVLVSGDSIEIASKSFLNGNEYLIEIGIAPSNPSTYTKYNVRVDATALSFICSAVTCPSYTCDLICNGGFANITNTVNNWSQLGYASGWSDANGGTSDLFSLTASVLDFVVPCITLGYRSHLTNTCSVHNQYVGILNSAGGSGWSEYIQTMLTTTMTPGQSYVVSFYVSKAAVGNAQLNKLSYWLTSSPINVSYSTAILSSSYPPAGTYTNSTVLNTSSPSNWNKVSFCYQATGNEQFLTIGMPDDPGALTVTSNTVVPPPCTSGFVYTWPPGPNQGYDHYLYIDEVSVMPFTANAGGNQTVTPCGIVNLSGSAITCGTTSIAPLTYSWTGSSGVLSGSQTATVFVNATPTSSLFTFYAFGTLNGTSCVSNNTMSVISATPFPLAITPSANSVCPGQNVTLTASGGVGTYTWLPGNSNSNPLVVAPTSNTTYTVLGQTSNGCIISQTIAIYTYTDVISVSSSTPSMCQGATATLTASGGSGFTWMPGSLSGSTVAVSPSSTTIYTVTGITTAHSCTKTNTISITINPLPTLTISPAVSNTICLNDILTLTASGASTYTWLPSGINTASINLSPSTATTYTVIGASSFGCVSTKTAYVFVNSLPTVNCSTNKPMVCQGSSATLTATGTHTYNWFPGGPGASIVVSPPPISSVNYTVIGTNTLTGCTNSCVVTQSVFLNGTPFFTVTATPSVVCGPTSGTSTLLATGSPNSYTWIPSGTVQNFSVVPAGTYTVRSTSSLGCLGQVIITVGTTDGDATLTPLPTICTTQTLDLSGYANPYPAGTFSINGSSSSNIFGPLSAGTYTIGYTYTSGILCNNTATSTINVVAVPATPTIASSYSMGCTGNVTLTATPSGPTYTWEPGGYVGNPYVYNQTSQTVFTVVVGTGNCIVASTYSLDYNNIPCDCVYNGCQSSLFGTVGSQPTNSVYCVTGNLTISGAVTFTNSDFRIAPGATITVLPSSTLTILGCHLYACGDMWQGIVVQNGGVVKLGTSSSGLTTMIEDAKVAVEVETYTLTTSATSVLTATNVVFNRNNVGIKLNKYDINQTTYPFTINNNLFTSRTITYTTLSWPSTSTVKNYTSTPSSALQTPYLNGSPFAGTTLKSPMSTSNPSCGIILNSVGYTSVSTTPTFKGMTIGITGATSYNVFENLYEGINATNSNVTIVNSIFQNAAVFGRGGSGGGYGIRAVSTQLTYSTSPAVNNQIKVVPASGTSFANKFYELTRYIDVTGYLHTEITYNEAYSYANAYSLYSVINAVGGLGFATSTNRYHTMKVTDNKMYNIKNNVTFDITTGDVFVGTKVGYGRYVGSANFNNNKISRHPTSTTVTAEYVNVGISINDAYAATTPSFATVGGIGFNVLTNSITSVHNGIGAYNVAYTPLTISSNSVTMVAEPTTLFGTPVQNGIQAVQLNTVYVHQNTVSGPASYTLANDIRAIKTSMNSVLSVKCNSTTSTDNGLDFNGSQPSTIVEDNVMIFPHKYGFSLNNNGVTGTLGSSTYPTNNLWLGTWTGTNYKTFTQDNSSTAGSSKLYVQWTASTSSLDPNGSGFTGGSYGSADYFHGASVTPSTTILDVGTNTVTPSCRMAGGGGGGRLIVSDLSVEFMEDLVQDKIPYEENITESRFIDKNRVYRLLQSDDSYEQKSQILDIFSTNNSNSKMETLFSIEINMLNGDISKAKAKINSLNSNGIEGNYKAFYNILINADDSLSNTDSLKLITLANSCPFTEGGVVYQARALYNQKYNVYLSYQDNCPKTSKDRLANNLYNNEIKVVFNSKLYPNPNTGEFNIEIVKTTKDQQIEISILDVTGKLVYNKNVTGTTVNLKPDLANGIYMVKVKLQDGTTDVHRLVINK